MQASIVVKSLAAASANNIATSQSLASAGSLNLNGSAASGGVATLDTQRRVIITSAGNDSGITWTVIGTREGGQPIKDQFAGGNVAAAQSNLDFLTVTSITASGATASTVTAGTNGVGSSPWKISADSISPPQTSFDCEITGTVSYQVEYTQQPFLAPIPPNGSSPAIQFAPASPNPTAIPFSDLTNKSAAAQGDETFVFHAWRLTILSGTGSVTCTGRQAGLASP